MGKSSCKHNIPESAHLNRQTKPEYASGDETETGRNEEIGKMNNAEMFGGQFFHSFQNHCLQLT